MTKKNHDKVKNLVLLFIILTVIAAPIAVATLGIIFIRERNFFAGFSCIVISVGLITNLIHVWIDY